jgi:hypothetical protein
MRGGKNPLVVEDTSSTDEAFGVVVPIPTRSLAASTENVLPSTEKPLVAVEVKLNVFAPCATVVAPANEPELL